MRALCFAELLAVHISIELDTGPLALALQELATRDVDIALTWALNDMAEEIRDDVSTRMNVVFDRPTPFTQKAFTVIKAAANRLEASVQLRNNRIGRDYLHVQEEGGARRQTGFEAQMSRSLAYEGVIQSILPADNARLDQYGNWSVGERNQVMSALKAQRDGATNMTDASWRRVRKRRSTYFVPRSGLTPGIYKKDPQGNLGVVAIFSAKTPVYPERLAFEENAERLFAAKMGPHLARTIGQMIAKRFG